jgi:hypothetical protein
MIRVRAIFLLALLLVPSAQAGQTYFVRKGGNDANNGLSWSTAWATSAKVQSTMVAGDTSIWGRGIWQEVRIKPPAGGSNSKWTVYACSTWWAGTTAPQKLAGVNLTVWTGGKAITGWVDTTVGGKVIQKAPYDPTVPCKTDADAFCYSCAWAARQGDSMLVPLNDVTSLGSAAPGYFHHNGAVVYVVGYRGRLASSDTIWVSCEAPLAFDNDNANHIRVWGIQIELGHNGAVVYRATNTDSTFVEHGLIRMGGQKTGLNPSAVYSEGEGNTGQEHNHVRACTLGWGVCVPASGGGSGTAPWSGMSHGAVANIYSQNHFVFDSCYVYGFAAHGFYFKLTKAETAPWEGSTVKNCIIDGTNLRGGNVTDPCGVFFFSMGGQDSAYGNIIKNIPFGVMKWYDGDPASTTGNGTTIFNNTFYNCTRAAVAFKLNGGSIGTANNLPHKVFYNVAQNSSTWSSGAVAFLSADEALQDTVRIDSNYWYNAGGAFKAQCYDNSNVSWTAWRGGQTCGGNAYDVHGFNANPGLSNPAQGVFSRPNAPAEMSRSYGGQVWTVFGAVQTAGLQQYSDSVVVDSPNVTLSWWTTDSSTSEVRYSKSPLLTNYTQSVQPVRKLRHSHTLPLDTGTYYLMYLNYDNVRGDTAQSSVRPVNVDYYAPAASVISVTVDGAPNLASGLTPVVSSTNSATSPSTVTDGSMDFMSSESRAWSSAASSSQPQWVELDFGTDRLVDSVVVHWAWNEVMQSWSTPQQLTIQRWSAGAWADARALSPVPGARSCIVLAPPISSSKIRLLQPANQGAPASTDVMSLSEVEVFGQ